MLLGLLWELKELAIRVNRMHASSIAEGAYGCRRFERSVDSDIVLHRGEVWMVAGFVR